jgi:hypothetical protein
MAGECGLEDKARPEAAYRIDEAVPRSRGGIPSCTRNNRLSDHSFLPIIQKF